MKTNISSLMSLIADLEKRSEIIMGFIRTNLYSIKAKELNGTTTVIEDTREEFQNALDEYVKNISKIQKYKSILYQKNNTLKLSDGRSIQDAIVDNNYLRKLKTTYEEMLSYNDSNRRITEVTNSYFECKMLNYDKDSLKKELNIITSKIQKTEFEISKLNSIEFNID